MRPNFAAAEFFFVVVDFIGSPLREPLRIVKEFLAYPVFGYLDDHGELTINSVVVFDLNISGHR